MTDSDLLIGVVLLLFAYLAGPTGWLLLGVLLVCGLVAHWRERNRRRNLW